MCVGQRTPPSNTTPPAQASMTAAGSGPHVVNVAKVIPYTADAVWNEMRDFIAHTRHFEGSHATAHVNSDTTGPASAGCQRRVDWETGPLVETCGEHSDAHRRFTVIVDDTNSLDVTKYRGEMKVTSLDGGHALAHFTAEFIGPASVSKTVGRRYDNFLGNIAAHLARPTTEVKVVAVGPPRLTTGRLAGKNIIVTGGASGIGAAVCTAMAKQGASVAVVDMNATGAEQLAATLPGGLFAGLDVTDSKMVDSMMDSAAAAFGGRVDIVVNNAGIPGSQSPTHVHPDGNWHKVINVNLNGAFYVLRAALRQMVRQEQRGGVVVNMASTTALMGMPLLPPYTAAKAAIVGLTKSTAIEYAKCGIRVVALAPTITNTPLVDKIMGGVTEELRNEMMNVNPMPGMPTSEEVADAAVFLASDEARWVSGSVLKVDGAYCAGKKFHGDDKIADA